VDATKFDELAARVNELTQKYDQLGYNAKKFRDEEESLRKQLEEARKEWREYCMKQAGFEGNYY
jgi:uncharacterized coiled-coil DUF342 family protein